MNKERLFAFLEEQDSRVLLQLLEAAYDRMTTDQRWEVFDKMMAAYLASLAAMSSPEQYAAAAVPLVRRDSMESFCSKTYSAALRAANKAQKSHLKAEVERQKIPAA
jgi:hypothetical protein